MKKFFTSFFAFLTFCIVSFLIVVYILFVGLRRNAEKPQILFVTDKYFYNDAYLKQKDKIRDFCKERGYKPKVLIFDTSKNAEESFLQIFNDVEKKDSAIIFLSPFATTLYVDNGPFNFSSLHYKPIIVGLGNRVNNELFDYIFDADPSLAFGQLTSIKDVSDDIFLYDSMDDFSIFCYNKFNSRTRAMFKGIVDVKTKTPDEIKEILRTGANIVTPGFKRLSSPLAENYNPSNFCLLYCTSYFPSGHVAIIPDICESLDYCIEYFENNGVCQNEDLSYFIRRV